MLKIAFYAAAAYLLIMVFLYLMQRSLIYFPQQDFPSPTEAGVPEMQVIRLTTSDDLVLNAWYRPPVDSGLPTVVYFHGNAGHIGHRAFIITPFLEEGYGILLLTYRGYSGNPGTPSEEGLYRDARAAMQYVIEQGVPNRCIVVYGNSIGAAVATQMATEYEVGTVILQSPFTSLADVGHTHYPFLPVRWLIKDRYDSVSKGKQIKAPIMLLHGTDDRIIPVDLSRRLFLALPEPKEAHYIKNRGHNDLFQQDLVISFIEKHACKPGS